MEGWLNIWKSINRIYYTNKLKGKKNTLDAEKTFGKIQHPFMLKVLERSRTLGPYLSIEKAIYNNI